MKQEGIRFGSQSIKQEWENIEKLETAINYLDVMLTTVSQKSLGANNEEKTLQVYMRGNEVLYITLNSKGYRTIGITEYVEGIDPILLHMLLSTVNTYIPHDFNHCLKGAFGIDLVKELNIEDIAEEVEVETPEPTKSAQHPTHKTTYGMLDTALAEARVTAILNGSIFLDDVLPLRIKPLVLDILKGYDLISQETWEKENNKLEHKRVLTKVVDEMTKRWNETTKPKGEER